MASILDIARDVADDVSLDVPVSLYGPPGHEEGDTTARRLRRAIEATCKYLQATHDWQQCKREHAFLTIEGERQPGSIPADFSRFVPDTMMDWSRRLPMRMAEGDADWQNARLWGSAYPARWIRAGGDLLITPGWVQGQTIGYSYISDAICIEPATAADVLATVDGMTLQIGKRYVVKSGHTVTIPVMGPGDHISLVPQGGEWRNLGASFTTADGGPLQSTCPMDYRDWISVAKKGAAYQFRPEIGAWNEVCIPTVNGMMLEAGRRYIVGQGHMIHLPVLAAGEQIELVPSTGSWLSHGSKITTRDGLVIAPPLGDVGIVTITADMADLPPYKVEPMQSRVDPWMRGRPKSKFSTDRDEPLWDAELVTLGAIWRMQYRDGNQYTEEFRAFQRMIYDRLKGSEGYGKIDMHGRGDGWPGRHGVPLRPRISGMMV